jgi:hypothetical protein
MKTHQPGADNRAASIRDLKIAWQAFEQALQSEFEAVYSGDETAGRGDSAAG